MKDLRKYLEFNKKIEIERMLPGMLLRRYRTALYKEEENEFCFYKPKENDTYVDFDLNEIVKIHIYTEEGIFAFRSRIAKNGTKIIRIFKPQTYKKIQRRSYLRVKLPVNVKIEYQKNSQKFVENVNVVDISGGGISFNTDCELFDIKKLVVHFTVEDNNISSFGEIIEIRKNKKPISGKYRLSVRFLSLSKKETELIIKKCIIYQIKLIKNKYI